ncbi:MAG TPA: disulfide bond formation protein B [Candidatus Paceibacterota bacterium]|nr:disulfide bond formation protein B [Candidatus Paceibacterota bacterium]
MLALFNLLNAGTTMLLEVAAVVLVVAALLRASWLSWVRRNAQPILFILLLASTAGSLIYEYAFHFPPCDMCWYQRIFIYSSMILLARALMLKKNVLGEVLTLLFFGLAFSLYHNVMDIFGLSSLSFCEGGPSGSLCLVRYVYEFGYITIPIMSLTVLVLSIIVVFIARNPQGGFGKH